MKTRRSDLHWLLIVGSGLLLLMWPLWLSLVSSILTVRDPLTPADALVPLAGGDDRIREAIRLYHQDYASRIVLADVSLVGPTGAITSRRNAYLATAEGAIAPEVLYPLDRLVTSTYTELEAVRDLAHREGWRSLILVTSPQHTRRTKMIARHVFADSGITVVVHPVVADAVDPARWWEDEDERFMTLMEYAKIAAFLVGYRGR